MKQRAKIKTEKLLFCKNCLKKQKHEIFLSGEGKKYVHDVYICCKCNTLRDLKVKK
jgi:superfamily II helicase